MAPLVFFVSAASSGFGKSIALEALKRGHKVIATARQSSKIAELEKSGAVTLDLDVTQPLDDLKTIVAHAHSIHGRIDILINPAGFILEGSIEEASPQETLDSFNTNVFGVLNLTRAVLPYMRAQHAGVIAHFGSVGSWQGVAAAGIYCATKWAVSGATEALRAEVAAFGIDVVCVEPGYFRTSFLNRQVKVTTAAQMDAYRDHPVAEVKALLAGKDNAQAGDVEVAARVIVDVVSRVDGRGVPMRLVLGRDAYGVIKQKCEDTVELMEGWKDVTCSTDHADSQ